MPMDTTRVSAAAFSATLALAACGGGSSSGSPDTTPPTQPAAANTAPGITVVSAWQAAATIAAPPDDLVILDVRTPEEFTQGHIEGAVMIDFYEADFTDQLARLDPDIPYVLYCRSGSRSGQTTAIMDELGFTSVQDVDGGVLAWGSAGLPLITK
ncbi:MAG: phage shock protein E [Candidatus Aldehydirespiratoraceae bacterium]|jgi:phage shock protein E